MHTQLNLNSPVPPPSDAAQMQENSSTNPSPLQITLEAQRTPPSAKSSLSNKVKCNFAGCTKRINNLYLAISKCRCEKIYCPQHFPDREHACTFDYREDHRKRSAERLEKKESKRSMDSHRSGHYAY